MTDFRMPSLGADMQFGTVVAWTVAPGAVVKKGEVIVEVETEKGVFEVESPDGGAVAELLVAKGTKVPVGTVLARIAPTAPSSPTPPPLVAGPPPPAPERRPHASPLARRVAEEFGVDLTAVEGTGTGGAITRADVERAAAARRAGAVTVFPPPGIAAPTAPSRSTPPLPPDQQISVDGRAAMRRAVAAAVSKYKREIPHYYVASDINLAAATAWLQAENARRPVTERVLPAALLLKAVAGALKAFPALNGFWVDGAPRPSAAIHIGVAISLRGGGLIAPAIHDVDRLTVPDVMRALQDLVRRARAGGLRGSEMTDATITVTNLGDEGASTVFGVIYPPQVALVGFGRIAERPWATHGMLGVHPVVTATLSADHRATDGHDGGRFLAEMDRLLQHPEAL